MSNCGMCLPIRSFKISYKIVRRGTRIMLSNRDSQSRPPLRSSKNLINFVLSSIYLYNKKYDPDITGILINVSVCLEGTRASRGIWSKTLLRKVAHETFTFFPPLPPLARKTHFSASFQTVAAASKKSGKERKTFFLPLFWEASNGGARFVPPVTLLLASKFLRNDAYPLGLGCVLCVLMNRGPNRSNLRGSIYCPYHGENNSSLFVSLLPSLHYIMAPARTRLRKSPIYYPLSQMSLFFSRLEEK